MTKISESVAQQLSEEWKSLPISVDEAQFKHFELLPVYLREHIWDQVQERFKASIRPSNEHWIQWDDAQLRQKWEDFLHVAAQTIQVPREDVIKLGQEFVQTWVPILVEPGENLVHWLYGEKVEMEVRDIEDKCQELLFFPELKNLIPLYLQRKELHVLSKVRASQIIQQLYTKLVEKFDWDRWERELETLYQVSCRRDIPFDWLGMYFDDRGLSEWSHKLPPGNLTVNQLLDILKSPVSQIQNPESGSEIVEESSQEIEAESNELDLDSDSSIRHEPAVERDYVFNPESDEESEEPETPPLLWVADEQEEEEDHLHPDSLASLFMKAEPQSEDQVEDSVSIETPLDDVERDEKNPIKNEIKAQKEDSIFGDEDWLSGDSISSKSSADHSTSQELSGMFDDEDSLFNRPIKKAQSDESEEETENDRLASSVFGDSTSTPSTSSTTSAYDEQDSYLSWQEESDEGSLDASTWEEKNEKQENRLAQTLKKNRKKYIKKLFKGSEEDYLDVLEKLESKSIWPKVVSCLQKEVIPDFEIDMTTKVMVQFTDELEKYFND
ncbi:hypothetical protein OBA44_01070 [Bacteroidota bacterium]|jgi:hypothetical protein|nr:hypothetical protein [Bacteroidota bacterium]